MLKEKGYLVQIKKIQILKMRFNNKCKKLKIMENKLFLLKKFKKFIKKYQLMNYKMFLIS